MNLNAGVRPLCFRYGFRNYKNNCWNYLAWMLLRTRNVTETEKVIMEILQELSDP
jgi:hypothetical protein